MLMRDAPVGLQPRRAVAALPLGQHTEWRVPERDEKEVPHQTNKGKSKFADEADRPRRTCHAVNSD